MAGRPQAPPQYLPMPPPQQQYPGMPMPGQPPGYRQPQGGPASNNSTTIIIVVVAIVAVVLLVAIVVPLMMYTAVSGLGPGNTPQNVTMVLQGSNSAGNFTFTVTSITSSNVNPTQLTYLVESNGITYYSGAAGLNAVTSGTAVNVTFNDNLDVGHVSAGDTIRLTGSPSSNPLHGGTFKVFFSNAVISTATIP